MLRKLVKWFLPRDVREDFETLRELRRKNRFGGYQLLVIDYPVHPRARYGYGAPVHPQLNAILGRHTAGYAERLRSFRAFQQDLARIPLDATDDPREPYWRNRYFEGLDALSLYCFLSLTNPKRYVEIGSGNSTKFARRAICDHGLQTHITSIDPSPRAEIDGLCDQVVRQPLEELDWGAYDKLEAGDILVVDGSHRCFANSDVTVVFLEILPNLKPGVLVYIDDVYVPLDYPPSWQERYYSEQYLLAVLLLSESPRYEPWLACQFVEHEPSLRGELEALWHGLEACRGAGNGFWMLIK